MTVENAGERYIADVVERLRDRKPSTVAGYKAILEKHLAVFFRGVAIDRVDEAMVEQYMTAKRGRPANLTAATVTRHVILLGGITRYAVRKGWAMRNPVANVEKPISSRSDEIRFLDVEQVEVLLRAAPTDDDLDNARRCIVRGVC